MSVHRNRELAHCTKCGKRASRWLWCANCWGEFEHMIDLAKLDRHICADSACLKAPEIGFGFCTGHLNAYCPKLAPLADFIRE